MKNYLIILTCLIPSLVCAEPKSPEQICKDAKEILAEQPRQVQDILNNLCGQYWDKE